VATGIIRSPSIATKLKSQLRRRSVKALRSSELYDDDNHAFTSTEVVNNVAAADEQKSSRSPHGSARSEQRFGTTRASHTPVGRELETDVRASVAKSLDWLKPLLER
jgi:hypothetical protein